MKGLTAEQKALAVKLTKLQLNTVINIECHGMKQVQAYQKAGGKSKGKHAEIAACKLLGLGKVKEFRASFAQETVKNGIMTREEALERLSVAARIRITDVCEFEDKQIGEDENGDPVMQTVWVTKNSKDIDPDVAACIKSVTVTRNGPKIELHDQLAALKQLAEMQGWNAAQKHQVTGEDGGPIEHRVDAPEIAKAIKDVAKFL